MAEHLAGSEEGFAALMNTKAKSLGMHNTTFKNASGWPDAEQLTTARDMYLLASAIQRDFPDYYHYFSIQSFTYNNITQANRNGLLRRDNSVDGMKTGHIESAGYHLVSSAQRNDNRVISVMMGTTSERSRENESMKVLGWAFTQFDHYTALRSGDTVEQAAPVWMGARPQVPLVAAEDVTLYLSRAERGKVSAEVVYQSPLKAPLQKGQQVGKIIIRGEGPDMPEISVPALVAVDVPELGFLGKLIATVANKFGN
jgi:serine-type D-Ala-D-Ala carboxypeptidase (penicillin-binding protein 5/6)